VLYSGGFRLPADDQPDTTMQALLAAARAGQLTGARMPVTWRTS
jgi:hypothetical protein